MGIARFFMADLEEPIRQASGLLAQEDYGAARDAALAGLELAKGRLILNPRHEELYEKLGYAYFYLGEFEKALECHQAQLDVISSGPGRPTNPLLCRVLQGLANPLVGLGRFAEARSLYERMVALAREAGSPSHVAMGLQGLASVCLELDELPAALRFAEECLALDETHGHDPANTLLSLGKTHLKLGHFRESIDCYRRAGSCAAQPRERAASRINLAAVDLHIGHYAAAASAAERLLAEIPPTGSHHLQVVALQTAGMARLFLNETKVAQSHLEGCLELAKLAGNRRVEAEVAHVLGHLHLRTLDLGAARGSYSRSLAIRSELGNPAFTGAVLASLAMTDSFEGNLERAAVSLEEALEMIPAIIPARRSVLHNHALVLFRLHRRAEAKKRCEEAVAAAIQSQKNLPSLDRDRIALYEEQFASYDLLQQILIETDDTSGALEVTEAARSPALGMLLGKPWPDFALARERCTLEGIKTIAAKARTSLLYLSLIQEARSGGEFGMLFWKVTQDGEVVFRQARGLKMPAALVGSDAEESETSPIRGVRDLDPATRESRRVRLDPSQLLDRSILKILQDLVPAAGEQLVLIPDALLSMAPLGMLEIEPGMPLAFRNPLAVAPSAAILGHLGARQGVGFPKPSLVIGNPTWSPDLGLPPLPGAELEARAIARLLETEALIGPDATKARVLERMEGAAIIHLATHGRGGSDDGQFDSAELYLSAESEDLGILRPDDIARLRLSADLVVLSACWTGVGRLQREGTLGLVRAFLAAGARSVVASLWQLEDRAAQELMMRFYQNMIRHGLPQAMALQQAFAELGPGQLSSVPLVIFGDPGFVVNH